MSKLLEALEGLTRWERPIVEGATAQADLDREHDARASELEAVTERAVLNAMANARDWKRSKKNVSKVLREHDTAAYNHFRKVVSVCSAAAGMTSDALEDGAGAKDVDAALASVETRDAVVEALRDIRDGKTDGPQKLNARAVEARKAAKAAGNGGSQSDGDTPDPDGPTFSTEQAAWLSDLRKLCADGPFAVTPEEYAEHVQAAFLHILKSRQSD